MAGVKVILGCPDCGRRFSYVHDRAGEPEDQFCPFCGADESAGVGMDFTSNRAPTTTSNAARAVNEAYRQMEGAGFTDMKDGLREGDTAAPSLTKDQSEMAKAWDSAKTVQAPIVPAAGFGGNNFLEVARNATQHARAQGIGDPLVPVLNELRKSGKHHHGTPIDTLRRARR